MAKCLARVDVRHMDFDDGYGQDGQCIADPVAVVCPGPGIDQHGLRAVGVRLMDAVYHRPFAVGLEATHPCVQFRTQRLQLLVDFRQGGRAVLGRIALTEHVQVDAMQNEKQYSCGAAHACCPSLTHATLISLPNKGGRTRYAPWSCRWISSQGFSLDGLCKARSFTSFVSGGFCTFHLKYRRKTYASTKDA